MKRMTAEDLARLRATRDVAPTDQLRVLDELAALMTERAALAAALDELREPWACMRRGLSQLHHLTQPPLA